MPADWFALNPMTLAGIAIMAAVTIGLKLAGFYTQRLMHPGPRVTRFLNALPGTVILSLTAPMALSSGITGVAALAGAVAVMMRGGNAVLATASGLALGLALRHGFGV